MNTDPSQALRITSDEVLLRIGRNMLVLQRIEGNLKRLVATGRVSAPVTQFWDRLESQQSRVASRTLGMLAGDYAEFHSDGGSGSKPSNIPPTEPVLSFTFHFKSNATAAGADLVALESLVEERNRLIHHFLEQHDITTQYGCTTACAWLDTQHELALRRLHVLREMLDSIDESRQAFLDYVIAPAFAIDVERDFLRQSLLVVTLGKLAMALARADGWTVFQTATRVLREQLPHEAANIKVRYGHARLKPLLLATELFDTREETTVHGGQRLLYRIRPEWALVEITP